MAECAGKATPQIADPFLATTEGEEAKCAGVNADVLVSLEEVTKQVKQGVTDKMKPAEALERRNVSIAGIEKACAQKSGNVCAVVKLSSGERYDLYQYKRYADVRLVFASEFGIANFGGSAAEVTYPRYSMDVAFLRAYETDSPPPRPTSSGGAERRCRRMTCSSRPAALSPPPALPPPHNSISIAITC